MPRRIHFGRLCSALPVCLTRSASSQTKICSPLQACSEPICIETSSRLPGFVTAHFTILGLSLARFDAISIWRTEEEGPLSDDSLNDLKLLVPHVQTALEVRRLLGSAQQRLHSAQVLANANPRATFVLDQHGVIKHCNTAAQSLVRSGDGLRVENGRLIACDPGSRASFCEFVFEMRSVLHPLSGGKSSGFFALKRGRNKRPLQAEAQPLPDTGTGLDRDLLLVVTDPEGSGSCPEDALRALTHLPRQRQKLRKG